jgi:anaerobic magnesium-protoporphyrin IX monomethyl ester cyclase
MNVLLINPPSLSFYYTFGFSLPPIGLLYVAACLEKAGHRVVVRDLAAEGAGVTDKDIKDADLVGISSDTTRIGKAMGLARKAARLGRPVIMGGPHPQFDPEDILSGGWVKAIVRGEGERVVPELVESIASGNSPASVRGVIFRDKNRIISTADADPVELESLPLPARHLVDLNRYRATLAGLPVTPIVTSRGCPGACHFCSSSSFFGRGWRCRSADSVLSEIEEIYGRYGFRAVVFMDDNFTLDPGRVVKIAGGIQERGLDLKWWTFSRVDTIVRNPEMVKAMAASGAVMVYMGIESGNEETLKSLGKNTKSSDQCLAVDILRKNGIESYGSYIIGNLNEGPEDVENTINRAIRLDTNIAQFSILTPYPGTRLYEEVKDRIFRRGWKCFDGLHSVFRHPRIRPLHLQFLLLMAFVRFYRRSREAVDAFRSSREKRGLGLRHLVVCAWELIF